MKMTRRNFLSASALTLLSCQLAPAARADCLLSDLFHGTSARDKSFKEDLLPEAVCQAVKEKIQQMMVD